MASTYSNLKIQLMATGENSATWGNVTNVNMGTALEEAITGSADVAFSSANVTLTLTDTNTTQTARNLRLNLTGTATAGYNLIVPAIEKAYIVNNATDGTITVKNATGTGIAVPTGKTVWVFNNGTNVLDVTTHLTSLTLATALPVLSGGTGSNTASGARTNLGLGTISTQNSNAVTITGGSITGITDLAVADGGTGASDAATARTNLGATTVGGNVFTLTNPSAITFPRFNADNTVSALDAATFRTAIGASSTTGTVTSVGGTGTVNGLTLTGTVTSTGNLTLGGTLSGVSLTAQVTGTLPVGNGGTNATTAGGARTSLGSTTLGDNLFTITNPSAITFPRFNADNTVSALDAATFRTAIGAGTVTSVGFTGGIVSVATATTTPAFTIAGTSGGIPYFSSGTTWATSAALAANAIVVGGGAGVAPATVTTGTGVVTALGVNTGTAGAFVVNGGALGTPSSGTLTNCSFPTLNQNTTGSAATLTTARTLTIGSTGKTFDGSANVSWTLAEIGAAASGANTDITALDQDITITATGTIAANTIGYRGLPQNAQTSSYTLALSDAGKHISITTGGVVVPANGSIAFPIGSTVIVYNDSASSQNITITTDTMYLAGTATTGTRALAQRGLATLVKVAATTWVASGAGLT